MQPISKIKAQLGIEPNGKVQKFFTNTCYRYMSPFVPGGIASHLNQNVILADNYIDYNSPDAHYQYIGKVMGPNIPIINEDGMLIFRSPKGKAKYYTGKSIKYHTPGTGAFWDKRAWTSKGKEIEKETQQFVDRGCK